MEGRGVLVSFFDEVGSLSKALICRFLLSRLHIGKCMGESSLRVQGDMKSEISFREKARESE